VSSISAHVLVPLLFTFLTYYCAVLHSSNQIKPADDTTVVGLISYKDGTTYRVEVNWLVDWWSNNKMWF